MPHDKTLLYTRNAQSKSNQAIVPNIDIIIYRIHNMIRNDHNTLCSTTLTAKQYTQMIYDKSIELQKESILVIMEIISACSDQRLIDAGCVAIPAIIDSIPNLKMAKKNGG